jgi:hypothetical protein
MLPVRAVGSRPRVLVPNQAAFPDTARLASGSAVIVTTLTHLFCPAGLLYNSAGLPWNGSGATTAYAVRRRPSSSPRRHPWTA